MNDPFITPATPSVLAPQKAYIEHVAVRVRDIHWHIRFFHDVLGMTAREIDGPAESPRQYWTVGGMQLMATPDFTPPPGETGQLAHLGVMVEDVEAALALALTFGVRSMAHARHWIQLPDGLVLELLPASGNAVREALAVNPRA